MLGEAQPTAKPDPLSQGFGGQDLMAQVRALYEDSAVPVREIARRAGVTERTLYKYARKHNWKPRYAWMPDGARPPGRPARRRWSEARERALQVAPAKGAGGRFIRREDAGQPFAQGIKATDAAGRAASLRACAEAARDAECARLDATVDAAAEEVSKVLVEMNRLLAHVQRHCEACHGRKQTENEQMITDALNSSMRTVAGLLNDVRQDAREANAALDRFKAQNRCRPGHIRVCASVMRLDRAGNA